MSNVDLRKFEACVPAKVNLSLAITGRRGDLHTLDMIVCPSRAFEDRVAFLPSDSLGVVVEDAYDAFDPKRFEAMFLPKAATIAQATGVMGTLYISKRIPLGAGLGGSSACTVGAVRAMEKYLLSIGKSMRLDTGFLLSLGSDVPAMMSGVPCRVQGVGEVVIPLEEEAPEMDIRVAEGGSDSGECYRLYDELPCPLILLRTPQSVAEAVEEERNDLTVAACNLNPNIAALIAQMRKEYAHVVMSGSGSAVVGIGKKRPK